MPSIRPPFYLLTIHDSITSFNPFLFYPNTSPPFSHLVTKICQSLLRKSCPASLEQTHAIITPNTSDPSYELTQTSPLAISPQLFHFKLKTLLFSKSYPDSSCIVELHSYFYRLRM